MLQILSSVRDGGDWRFGRLKKSRFLHTTNNWTELDSGATIPNHVLIRRDDAKSDLWSTAFFGRFQIMQKYIYKYWATLRVAIEIALLIHKNSFFFTLITFSPYYQPFFFHISLSKVLLQDNIKETIMAFITTVPSHIGLRANSNNRVCLTKRMNTNNVNQTCKRSVLRMGLGEDGLKEDLEFAQSCVEGGCAIDAVQDVLTRLERRRAVLALEVSQIEDIMAVLAKENLGGDRNLVAEAMAAAVSIFAKTNDDYPGVGSTTNAWTLDPIKKQPKF